MIVQEIYLREYDWYATIFYAQDEHFCQEVLDEIKEIGCFGADLRDARRVLQRGGRNTGFTYSNPERRESVIYIAPTDNAAQFMDSYDHEKGHLAMHIATEFDLNVKGEDYQYLVGEIGRQTFPAAKNFLCDCCRNGRNKK